MINKILSISSLSFLPIIYLSGQNKIHQPLFAVMSPSVFVGATLISLATLVLVVTYRPKLLTHWPTWISVGLLAAALVGLFTLSLVSTQWGYRITYYFEPLDLFLMAQLEISLIISCLLNQPATRPELAWRKNLSFIRQQVVIRRLSLADQIRQLLSGGLAPRPPRTL